MFSHFYAAYICITMYWPIIALQHGYVVLCSVHPRHWTPYIRCVLI